jgi:competence protein ComEA
VVTGSFNFSRNAAQTNDENLLIVVGSREIARLYTEEFERLTGTTAAQPAQTSAPPKPTDPLPINTATQEEIERLPGIGPVIARRIIAGRPYRTLTDLEHVPGLGPRKIEAIKGQITFR